MSYTYSCLLQNDIKYYTYKPNTKYYAFKPNTSSFTRIFNTLPHLRLAVQELGLDIRRRQCALVVIEK